MLAFAAEKAMRCVMCGTAPWEWDDEQGGSRFAYEAVEVRCPGCEMKSAARSDDPTRNLDGITVELSRTGTMESAKRHIAADRAYQKSSR